MLILNEEKYAENLYLGKNDDVKAVSAKVRYITRYNLYVLGQDDDSNYQTTVMWMSKNHDNFDESCYANLVADAVKKAHKFPFYNIDKIVVTKSELEKISSLNNLRAEKVLFVLLCMAKHQKASIGFTNGLVKYSITALCKMARISVPADEREYILHRIVQAGLLGYPKKNDTQCLIVNFIGDDDVALELDETDCKELAYVYLNWKDNGVGYTRCECCGRLTRKYKKNKTRFCEECSIGIGDVLDDQKIILCVDCNKPVLVSVYNNKTCRCTYCQENVDIKLNREASRERMQRYRFNK